MIDWREHLTSDPKVCGGQLCAKGTRVLVTVILDNLAEGLGREEILRSYPTLERTHIAPAATRRGKVQWRASRVASRLIGSHRGHEGDPAGNRDVIPLIPEGGLADVKLKVPNDQAYPPGPPWRAPNLQ
ncbi:MAG: DUF433 domain-containing protein [Candidatus Rokuibacteriota bacterium]